MEGSYLWLAGFSEERAWSRFLFFFKQQPGAMMTFVFAVTWGLLAKPGAQISVSAFRGLGLGFRVLGFRVSGIRV